MSKLDITDVTAAHGVKLAVGREKDAGEARSDAREVLTGRPTAATWRCCWCWRRRWSASYEIELTNFRGPVGAAGHRKVFVHMPEVHAIGGINGCIGVIAPAPRRMGLRAAAVGHDRFALAKVTRRIGFQASSVTEARKDAGAGYGITNGRITRVIDGNAGHKTPHPVAAFAPILLLPSRIDNHSLHHVQPVRRDDSRP